MPFGSGRMKLDKGEIKIIVDSLDREASYYMNKAERFKNNSLGKFYSKKADVYKKLMLKLLEVKE